MDDLVERLRNGGNDFCADGPCWPGDDMLEAAAQREADFLAALVPAGGPDE